MPKEIDYARRFLVLWGTLSLVMFLAAGAFTFAIVRVAPEGEYHPIGMYGAFRTNATGWIYFEHRRRESDFLLYYPAGTTAIALPRRVIRCNKAVASVRTSAYEGREYDVVTLSNAPRGVSSAGTMTCTADFSARRDSFTGLSMDVWFLPHAVAGHAPIARLNVSAIVEGAESMQVLGARSTSASGADLAPDDETVFKYNDIHRESLRDILLVLIGAFVALGAAMALEAIRPYVEARAGLHPY